MTNQPILPNPDKFLRLVAMLEAISRELADLHAKVDQLADDVDTLDRIRRPYGDGTRRRGRAA